MRARQPGTEGRQGREAVSPRQVEFLRALCVLGVKSNARLSAPGPIRPQDAGRSPGLVSLIATRLSPATPATSGRKAITTDDTDATDDQWNPSNPWFPMKLAMAETYTGRRMKPGDTRVPDLSANPFFCQEPEHARAGQPGTEARQGREAASPRQSSSFALFAVLV